MLIQLAIPPGVYRNGTDYQQAGRWRDANLVRWVDGALKPIGGWRNRITSAFSAAPRGIITWEDNSGDRYIALGNYNKLYAYNVSNTRYDITPAGLVAGTEDAAVNIGYGGGTYGTGFYGVPRSQDAGYTEATSWSLDTWGEYLVACSTADGELYEWDLDTGGVADPIANSPTGCSGLLVTEERFLFALGAGGNPRKVQWSDREDNTTWTPAATNEAGDIELQTSGNIMCATRVTGRALILTNLDAHIATYNGPPYVYGFERVGTNCGIVSRQALISIDDAAFWMGSRGFFMFDGSNVVKIPCEVEDYVFNDLNPSQVSKVSAQVVSEYGEVWWYYPDSSSNENSRYVAYNYRDNHWTIGEITRTCGIDAGVFSYPMATDEDSTLYEHEVGLNVESATVFAETGPITVGNGDEVVSAVYLYPDELTQGDVTATFKSRFYPNGTERSYGPYSMATPTSVRFTGRQIRMRVEGAKLADWRVGTMRVDLMPRGKR